MSAPDSPQPSSASSPETKLATHLQSSSRSATPIRPRKDRPCDACRRRKTRCVTQDDSLVCGFCKLHSKECTYLEKPLPRKRKPKDPLAGAPRAQVRRLDSSDSSSIAGSRPGTSHKADPLGGHLAEHALLTPVSDVHLDWWPRGDSTAAQKQIVNQLPFDDDLFGSVEPIDAHLVTMAWRVPLELVHDHESEASARMMHDKWSLLLRRQAMQDLPGLSLDAVSSIFDPTASAQAFGSLLEIHHPADAAVFRHMISLSKILSTFLEVFPNQLPLAEPSQDPTREALVRAKPVQIALKEWFTALPSDLKMDHHSNGSPTDEGLSSIASLHLCYYALEVHLHTRIISSISPPITSPDLVGICRHAAKSRLLSAMDFVNRLRPRHLQSLAWHPVASANFAAIGIFADLLRRTAMDSDESQWYEQRLREFRWTVGVSNRNALWLGPVVEVVDGLLERAAF